MGGSLLAAVVISQFGVTIDNGVKSVMFAVFIYAVGYDSGPGFFNSLNRKTLREIAMAIFLAVSALITVVVCAKLFHLNKGLAAGLAGGALTQSAIIGTAGDAIARLSLPADEIKSLQSDVAIAYAVTYVFGSLGAIIVCVNILPKFMGQGLREASIEAEKELSAGSSSSLGAGQIRALPELVGRAYKIDVSAGKTVKAVETQHQDMLTIERIRRDGKNLEPTPDLALQLNDEVLVMGRREAVVAFGANGNEIAERRRHWRRDADPRRRVHPQRHEPHDDRRCTRSRGSRRASWRVHPERLRAPASRCPSCRRPSSNTAT